MTQAAEACKHATYDPVDVLSWGGSLAVEI